MKKNKKRIISYALCTVLIVCLLGGGVFLGYRVMGEKKIKDSIIQGNKNSKISKTIEVDGETYQYKDNVINILCLGIAKETAMEAQVSDATSMGQSDAVYLMSLDTDSHKMKVLSIPRESMVPVEMYDINGNYTGTEEKQLTLQYAYGDGKQKSADLTKARVEEILKDIPIHRVCALNYTAIPILNDAVGGVEVTVKEDFSGFTDAFVQGETITLKGEDAIQYLRVRDITVFKSSTSRIKRQEDYLMSFARTAKEAVKHHPALPIEMYRILKNNMYTDISSDEVTYLASEILNYEVSGDNFYTLEGETKVVDGHEAFYPDNESVHNLLTELFYQKAK